MTGTKLRFLALTRSSIYWVQAQLIFTLMWILRLLPHNGALKFLSGAARLLGPFLGRNRIAMENLSRALPDLSAPEREFIAGDMWENMARLAGEYIFGFLSVCNF